MPQTKSRPRHTLSVEEQFKLFDNTEKQIFWAYLAGLKSDGKIGYDPEEPVGSVSHLRQYKFLTDSGYTTHKFRGKAIKVAGLSKIYFKQGKSFHETLIKLIF